MVNKNMLATLLPICCQKYNKNSKNNIINTIYILHINFSKHRNINSIDNIINTDNTKFSTTCGSGKKYKNCCGRNQ